MFLRLPTPLNFENIQLDAETLGLFDVILLLDNAKVSAPSNKLMALNLEDIVSMLLWLKCKNMPHLQNSLQIRVH